MAIEDIRLAPPELADEIFSSYSILRNFLEKYCVHLLLQSITLGKVSTENSSFSSGSSSVLTYGSKSVSI